jgi:hypothetical protein
MQKQSLQFLLVLWVWNDVPTKVVPALATPFALAGLTKPLADISPTDIHRR